MQVSSEFMNNTITDFIVNLTKGVELKGQMGGTSVGNCRPMLPHMWSNLQRDFGHFEFAKMIPNQEEQARRRRGIPLVGQYKK